MQQPIIFFDTEIGVSDQKIHDIGAVRSDGAVFRRASVQDFCRFLNGSRFVCGHNIIHHDLFYLQTVLKKELPVIAIDTLYLSPLLFPKRPYHALLKDDKLQVDELNNPVNDSKKAQALFYDECNAFFSLPAQIRQIYCGLLYAQKEFAGFFEYVDCRPQPAFDLPGGIRTAFDGRFCSHANLALLIRSCPVELAYALALIRTADQYSITPPWLMHHYPKLEHVIRYLCGTPCSAGCSYCRQAFDLHKALKRTFGYEDFRRYDGEPLQEMAAKAAVEGKSLLAVFPTGGGKSITFQLPALMAGKTTHGLTVVISPLQSLMKDQVDNLSELGITEAVTVNGLLDPIERANALERVANGSASLLYISPEQLRSATIERLLLGRSIARFVIDEAHCFSAWGQDFRVDYLYIGDFIRSLQAKKSARQPIPVSCFTATAKQKVISDIRDYFLQKLGLQLELFTSAAARKNLRYTVLHKETDEEKYTTLRNLVSWKSCPTIVYVSRTGRAMQLAQKLAGDGFLARPFHGKMDPADKIANQEAFIRDEVQIIVATSAFGMGVDKKDVGLVIHYDISDSLESYVQEAGRAGRDPAMQADCYVLYCDKDLDKHFILLNQTKLSISEIQQVWKAIKDLTRHRPTVLCSALEIARQAGWDDSVTEIETRVRTAVSALENAGYVKRGYNVPHVYATSICAKNMQQAANAIDRSGLFSPEQRQRAKRIVKSLISSRSIAQAGHEDGESRVDYLADMLGLTKGQVIECVNLMRQEGILDDAMDMSAHLLASDTENRSVLLLERFAKLEGFLAGQIPPDGRLLALKEINEAALAQGISFSSIKNLRTLIYYFTIKGYLRKTENQERKTVRLVPAFDPQLLEKKRTRRLALCRFILHGLYAKAEQAQPDPSGEKPVQFSLVGLYRDYCGSLDKKERQQVVLADVEDALLYLSKIGALKLDGGFLVLYNGMQLKRLILDNRIRYKAEDYRFLDEFYKQKIRQIHIVGEYANLMVEDYTAALQFVQDYFQMDFRKFIAKYFKGERAKEIDRNITPGKYNELFGGLSQVQEAILSDSESQYIVVAAGPGSGKTRVLVHKLAALVCLEDVKHEQLLMLTFSRAAATEFKKRLFDLIGNAARFIDIKTFHSYCFDLLGKIGNLQDAADIVKDAAAMIESGEVEPGKITKRVLVIDEAQDMSESDFALVRALMRCNEEMRVIAVGDDDQNIYEFRGSNSRYLRSLVEEYGAVRYEMVENYRSCQSIVALSSAFARTIQNRMKQTDGRSMAPTDGTVVITHHRSEQFAQAAAQQLADTYHGQSACVLTQTNEEALEVLGLLLQREIPASLVQSLDGFRMYDLAEVRYFLRQLESGSGPNSSRIPDEEWAAAKEKLFAAYAQSACLKTCKAMLRDFEATSPVKYRTDLVEFFKESRYEDFYSSDAKTVSVSTIHRSKGREYDAVYMLIDGKYAQTDAEKRKLYVGLTRARNELYIHCGKDRFREYTGPSIQHRQDDTLYEPPCELRLQLGHRDVYLNHFKGKKRLLLQLRSGAKLEVKGTGLYVQAQGRPVCVARLSKSCQERLQSLYAKGYRPLCASIRFLVAWRGQEDEDETAVLLPDLLLKRL